MKVWIIPADSEKLRAGKIRIQNNENSMNRLHEYEVDHEVFDTEYKNLDLSDIPEFEERFLGKYQRKHNFTTTVPIKLY